MLFIKWESTSLTDLHQNMQFRIRTWMIIIRKKTTFCNAFRKIHTGIFILMILYN